MRWLYNGIRNLINSIIKIKKRFKLVIKIKDIIIKVLNLGATGYSLFTMVEPFLNKDKKEAEAIDTK